MAQDENKIIDTIRHRLTEQLNIDFEQAKPDAAWEDLGADSLDTVELVMWAEDKFNVTISDDEAEQCCTVQDFARLIARK